MQVCARLCLFVVFVFGLSLIRLCVVLLFMCVCWRVLCVFCLCLRVSEIVCVCVGMCFCVRARERIGVFLFMCFCLCNSCNVRACMR